MPFSYSDNQKFEDSMLAMMTLGIGEILGGIGMGVIVDKVGAKRACLVNIFNIFCANCLVIYFIYQNEYGPLAFIITFAWGF